MTEPVEPHAALTPQALRAVLLDVVGTVAPETRGRPVTDDADLRVAFDLDSMDMLTVVRGVKTRLGVDVPAVDMPRMYTLASAVAVLQRLLR
jgi:acyl carrier protein